MEPSDDDAAAAAAAATTTASTVNTLVVDVGGGGGGGGGAACDDDDDDDDDDDLMTDADRVERASGAKGRKNVELRLDAAKLVARDAKRRLRNDANAPSTAPKAKKKRGAAKLKPIGAGAAAAPNLTLQQLFAGASVVARANAAASAVAVGAPAPPHFSPSILDAALRADVAAAQRAAAPPPSAERVSDKYQFIVIFFPKQDGHSTRNCELCLMTSTLFRLCRYTGKAPPTATITWNSGGTGVRHMERNHEIELPMILNGDIDAARASWRERAEQLVPPSYRNLLTTARLQLASPTAAAAAATTTTSTAPTAPAAPVVNFFAPRTISRLDELRIKVSLTDWNGLSNDALRSASCDAARLGAAIALHQGFATLDAPAYRTSHRLNAALSPSAPILSSAVLRRRFFMHMYDEMLHRIQFSFRDVRVFTSATDEASTKGEARRRFEASSLHGSTAQLTPIEAVVSLGYIQGSANAINLGLLANISIQSVVPASALNLGTCTDGCATAIKTGIYAQGLDADAGDRDNMGERVCIAHSIALPVQKACMLTEKTTLDARAARVATLRENPLELLRGVLDGSIDGGESIMCYEACVTVASVIGRVRALSGHFRSSTVLADTLIKALGEANRLCVGFLHECKTRWSWLCRALRRILDIIDLLTQFDLAAICGASLPTVKYEFEQLHDVMTELQRPTLAVQSRTSEAAFVPYHVARCNALLVVLHTNGNQFAAPFLFFMGQQFKPLFESPNLWLVAARLHPAFSSLDFVSANVKIMIDSYLYDTLRRDIPVAATTTTTTTASSPIVRDMSGASSFSNTAETARMQLAAILHMLDDLTLAEREMTYADFWLKVVSETNDAALAKGSARFAPDLFTLLQMPVCFRPSTSLNEGVFNIMGMVFGPNRRRLLPRTLERLVLLKIHMLPLSEDELLVFFRCVATRFLRYEGGEKKETFDTTQQKLAAVCAFWSKDADLEQELSDEEDMIELDREIDEILAVVRGGGGEEGDFT
jgi:hypothetical protein